MVNFRRQKILRACYISIYYFQLLKSRLKFFVRNCVLIQDDQNIPIVKNNCYSDRMNAKFESGKSHLVSDTSRFSYTAFVIGDGGVGNQHYVCEIMICLRDRCDQIINTKTEQCPAEDDDLPWEFTAFGVEYTP